MRLRGLVVFVSLVNIVCFHSALSAADELTQKPGDTAEAVAAGTTAETHTNLDSSDPQQTFSAQTRWNIKRQIMSRPGVFLDMGNLTDNGYSWSNDVVWEGSDLPTNEKWYIAGFLFERAKYKSVWLQYAFTLVPSTNTIKSFRRWFGDSGFR